ncbi:MAG: MlaD family protein [Myxococcota bacterium]
MNQDRQIAIRVGIFVLAAIAIGATIAFAIGNQRSVFGSKVEYRAVFDSVSGLRAGSPVRIAGLGVGTVGEVALGDDGRVHVRFSVLKEVSHLVREDSRAAVGNKGLLGDKLIDISAGQGEPLAPGSVVPTGDSGDLSQYLSAAGGIIDDVQGTVSNLRTVTEPLAEDQFGEDVQEIAHNLAILTRMAATEDGTVARLLQDPSYADRLDRTLRNVELASAELLRTSRSTRAIVDEVRAGDGSAHELIYGSGGARLVENLADMSGEANLLMAEVRTGDGMVHDLVYEDAGDAILNNVTQATTDLAALMSDIRAGRGTVGALLTDPSIYEDVKRLIGDLERNQILRALVRYSITRDETAGDVDVESEPPEE